MLGVGVPKKKSSYGEGRRQVYLAMQRRNDPEGLEDLWGQRQQT